MEHEESSLPAYEILTHLILKNIMMLTRQPGQPNWSSVMFHQKCLMAYGALEDLFSALRLLCCDIPHEAGHEICERIGRCGFDESGTRTPEFDEFMSSHVSMLVTAFAKVTHNRSQDEVSESLPCENLDEVANRCGVQKIDLANTDISSEVIALLPREICLKNMVVPVKLVIDKLTVAMIDPSDTFAIADIRALTGHKVEVVVASKEDIITALEQYYHSQGSDLADIAGLDEVAKMYGVPRIDLAEVDIDSNAIEKVTRDVCVKHDLIPVSVVGNILLVAMANPGNIFAIDDLKFLTGYNIEVVVANKDDIGAAISQYYSEIEVEG